MARGGPGGAGSAGAIDRELGTISGSPGKSVGSSAWRSSRGREALRSALLRDLFLQRLLGEILHGGAERFFGDFWFFWRDQFQRKPWRARFCQRDRRLGLRRQHDINDKAHDEDRQRHDDLSAPAMRSPQGEVWRPHCGKRLLHRGQPGAPQLVLRRQGAGS